MLYIIIIISSSSSSSSTTTTTTTTTIIIIITIIIGTIIHIIVSVSKCAKRLGLTTSFDAREVHRGIPLHRFCREDRPQMFALRFDFLHVGIHQVYHLATVKQNETTWKVKRSGLGEAFRYPERRKQFALLSVRLYSSRLQLVPFAHFDEIEL